MMRNFLIIIAATVGLTANAEVSEGDKLFALKVKPIFAEKCNGCHGDDAEKVKGDFNMLTREQLLKGGETIGSDVVVVGDASKSFLIESIKWEDPDFEMPPKENDRLTAEQISTIEKWINLGAPWPNDEVQSEIVIAEAQKKETDEGIIVETSGGLGDDWTYRRYKPEDIWGFMPVVKPEVDFGDQNPIDYFVGEKLEKSGFKAAAKADPRILIRRATFDLIGMPPTPREVYEFKLAYEEGPEKAWSDLIDRLLESKHYGERWAQHWLDIARYADTAGFSNDYERSNMWRYRDYVIRSLNNDKPYNDFIIEQIAGDELADDSLRSRIKDWDKYQKARAGGNQYNEQESEWLVASSFLRQGPWDPAMVKAPQARQLYVDDVVNGVGQTFLATTMRCFKCHDHKFDPLPTRDYYSMYTAFAATQLAERSVPFLEVESRDRFEESKALTQRLHQFAQERTKSLHTKREDAARAWYRDNGKEYVSHAERKNLPDEDKPPRHVGLTPEEKGKLKVREQDEWIWNRRLERYQPMVQTVYNGPDPSFLNARKMRMNAKANNKWRPTSKILTGGALEAPGDDVEPGVLSAVGVPTEITDELDGRRLGVAKWIADPKNQLTTRSIVNRIWQYHFGKPIAGNPNNFGVKGEKPTHPQLLDFLATDFVENGWTFKRLHKLIMMSDTYQQSGKHSQLKELETEDADNDLFAYFPNRRLSAEELRDSMLKVTGELNPNGGGLPIMPEMNLEVALQPRMIQFSIAPAYQPSPTPEERNRRSIYAYRVRGLANPFLETFNRPNPNDSCEDRDAASVSPQAFTLMNSDVVTARSIAFALRVEKERDALSEQVKRAVQLAYNRIPTAEEQETLESYVTEMRAYHKTAKPERKEFPTKITRSLVEEFTGEPFEYDEILPVYEDYTPDKSAADVAPETRALADLCLLLFNSHEFVYLY